MDYENNKGPAVTAADRTGEIESLLEKYFEGATSLEEEARLREFFTSGDAVPGHLEYATAMFGYFTGAAQQRGPAVHHPADCTVLSRNRRRRAIVAAVLSAAAALALALLFTDRPGAGTGTGPGVIYCYVDGMPVTDPELAVSYSEQAFARLSGSVREPLETTTAALEQFSNLQTVSRLAEISSLIETMRTNE